MKKLLRILALVTGLFSGGQAFAGIPVIDGANLAQAIQQVMAWAQQYQQMTQQIQQLQQQIESVTGSRGFSSVLNSPAFQQARRMLPEDAQTLLNLGNGGSYGNLASSINSIKQATSMLTASDFGSQSAADQWLADLNRAASNKALSQEAYNSAQQRLSNLEDLLQQISTTQDPKAIAELQARINVEQGLIQNEQAKINAMAMLVNAERQISEMQARDLSIRTAGTNRTVPRVQVTPCPPYRLTAGLFKPGCVPVFFAPAKISKPDDYALRGQGKQERVIEPRQGGGGEAHATKDPNDMPVRRVTAEEEEARQKGQQGRDGNEVAQANDRQAQPVQHEKQRQAQQAPQPSQHAGQGRARRSNGGLEAVGVQLGGLRPFWPLREFDDVAHDLALSSVQRPSSRPSGLT